MSEFLSVLGVLCAILVGGAGISFGLIAGLHAATWAFGPLNINVQRGDIHVTLNTPDDGAKP